MPFGNRHECHFIEGRASAMGICGKPVKEGYSWCQEHCERVFLVKKLTHIKPPRERSVVQGHTSECEPELCDVL